MRDVTPVEALDVKLSSLLCSLDPATASSIELDRESYIKRTVMTATPVAWSGACFHAVKSASKLYPLDVWPNIPLSLPLFYVFPDPIITVEFPSQTPGFRPEVDSRPVVAPVRALCLAYSKEPAFHLAAFHQDGRYWKPCLSLWGDLNRRPDNTDYDGASEDFRGLYLELIRFIFSSWTFLDQRLAVEERAHINRQARKRAERLDIEPVVHVVRLRKSELRAHHDAPHDVEWSCQWLVRGHWRNQWHPRMSRHAPVWITPHIKGPADMPLRTPAPEVWQVSR